MVDNLNNSNHSNMIYMVVGMVYIVEETDLDTECQNMSYNLK